MVNTAILGKAGVSVPTTSDELMAAIPKIRAAGYEVLAAPGQTPRGFFLLMMQAVLTNAEAAQLYGKGGYANNAHAREAIQLFVQYRDAGLFAKDTPGLTTDTANQLFFSGGAAMINDATWDIANAPAGMQPNIVIGGFPVPADSPAKKPVYYTGYNGKGVWITRNGAKKLDIVRAFVQYLYSPDDMEAWIEQADTVPPIQNPKVDNSKLNPLFAQSIALKNDQPVVGFDLLFPTAGGPAQRGVVVEALIPNKLSADEILTQLDQAAQSALQS